ncbi:hypothetical protein CAEBREN_31106 [Caenorhabditis brenneri]|uniref:Uncharacterized protein n=1 Tax=Caenorhabditis brenneri TaxID=135651 RepID=G0ML24_CAEBE|nr:hypothetical protein CAEBREN_31106 [Caenorhabditis brenneri]
MTTRKQLDDSKSIPNDMRSLASTKKSDDSFQTSFFFFFQQSIPERTHSVVIKKISRLLLPSLSEFAVFFFYRCFISSFYTYHLDIIYINLDGAKCPKED